MKRVAFVMCVTLSGCFDWSSLSSGPVDHLVVDDAYAGSLDLVIGEPLSIDTTALTLTPAIQGFVLGTSFQASSDAGVGPEVAVLRVRRFSLMSGITIRVTGARPLIVISGAEVVIDGIIDAGAHGADPGPGGRGPAAGPGAGRDGAMVLPDVHADSGGGGAGYGTNGGPGGDAEPSSGEMLAGAMGGPAYGDALLTILQGGSGGGSGGPDICARTPGGAGGGAVQITSGASIRVGPTGKINLGGGGGSGGLADPSCGWATAGAGGGSGGALVLEAKLVDVQGIVSANGGGGGSSGTYTHLLGIAGQDGQPGSVPASGGVLNPGASGGGGGTEASVAGAGKGGNYAGGGGGSVGRIHILAARKP